MLSFSHKLFELFKSAFSSLFLFKILLLVILLLSPAQIAYCLDLSFAWDANTEPDLAGYRVFCRQEGQNYDYNNPVWETIETTCTIFSLNKNATYYFVSRAFDIYGNESENSDELCYAAGITTVSSGGGGGGGGCFIATAAFGSKFEKHVRLLRKFRDLYLLPHGMGRAFVNAYYRYSPPVADIIADHDTLRAMVRWSLLPLVSLSWMLLHLGGVYTLLLLILIICAPIVFYKKIKGTSQGVIIRQAEDN
jgi:hypothetical protein